MSETKTKASLYTAFSGSALLETPLLNKGSAFSREERCFTGWYSNIWMR